MSLGLAQRIMCLCLTPTFNPFWSHQPSCMPSCMTSYSLSLHPSMLSPSPPLSLPNNSTASVDTLLISSTGGSLVNPGFNRSSIEISLSMICIFYLAKIWYRMPFLSICNPSHVPHLSWLDTVIRSTLAYGWQASSLHQIHNNFIMDWLNMLQMIAFYDYK